MFNKRAYATINIDALRHNINSIVNILKPETKILAVIKTDGYGHGAVNIAKEIEGYKEIFGYGVATVEEAMDLRIAGLKKPILILGYVFPESYEILINNNVRITIFDYDAAKELSDVAFALGKKALVHLKVDTGMSRIGLRYDNAGIDEAIKISELENLEIEGLFTHFARADETDKTSVGISLERFSSFADKLEERGLNIPIKHCSNSASIIDLDANFNMVRAGIILYGLWPSDQVHKENISLRPLMELHSSVTFVKEVLPGTEISYGGTFKADKTMKVATVGIGYGDGYPRILSNKGYVLIRGKKAPILGRVCMDQMMVDVSHIPGVERGDNVTLVGKDGDFEITMDEFSLLSERINYESVCDIGKRVPRIYIRDKANR